MSYTPAQVASINAAREAAVAAGQNPYAGAGATTMSTSAGLDKLPNSGTPIPQGPMTSDSLSTPAPQINLPTPPATPNTHPTIESIIAGLQNVSDGLTKVDPASTGGAKASGASTTATPADSSTNTFTQYINNLQAPVKTADIYAQERAASGVDQKQQTVNSLTASLNSIKANADAKKLSTIGQGRGIPEAIIGGQQAQIDREAAIEALPVAAQLAAAQGDLKLAQDHLDTTFKLRAEDAQNDVTYRNKLVDSAYNFADKQDQRALDDKKNANNQAFTLMTNNLNYAQTLASKAIENGQPGVAARLAQLDPKSPTYASDIAKLAGQIVVTKTGTGGSTVEERQASAIANYSAKFVPGAKLPSGIPVLDVNNQITPEAWIAAINDAPLYGLSREGFVKAFGSRIYNGETISSKYQLSPAEIKLVTGTAA